MTTLYGISNCDTVKKARKWLDAHAVNYEFHDFRANGLDQATVRAWVDRLGWEAVVNKRSSTWRGLSEAVRAGLTAEQAVAEIRKAPTLVKRPVLERGEVLHFGFDDAVYEQILG